MLSGNAKKTEHNATPEKDAQPCAVKKDKLSDLDILMALYQNNQALIPVAPSQSGHANFMSVVQHEFRTIKAANPNISLSDDELLDLVTIAVILNDETIVLTEIDALEQKVRQHAIAKNILGNIENEEIFFDTKQSTKFKLLSAVLYDWIIVNGFVARTAKILKHIEPDQFQSLLSDGLFFKDNGAGQRHGAWTHFIQWFVIIEFNKKAQILRSPPYTLYKLLGDSRAYISDYGDHKPIWNILIDTLSFRHNDFRSPERLNEHLILNANRYPLISTTLRKGNKMNLGNQDAITYKDHKRGIYA